MTHRDARLGAVRRALRALLVAVGVIAVVLLGVVPTGAAAGQGEAAPNVSGRLRVSQDGERRPVAGVEIVVSADGTEVGRAVSDEEGRWSVDVPDIGVYEVMLVLDTLPEGVAPEDDVDVRTVRVLEGSNAGAVFRLTAGEDTDRGWVDSLPAWLAPDNLTLERFLQLTVDGIKLGALIAIMAVGLSLVFGVTGLVNFAHGELVTIGAVVAWMLSSGGGLDMALVLTVPIVMLVGAAMGAGLETGLWGPLRRRQVGLVAMLLVSIGLSMVLRYGVLVVFGGQEKPFREYAVQRAWDLGPVSLTPKDLVIIVVSVTILVVLGILLTRTRLGTATRAVADNPALAAVSGIDVDRVIRTVWIVGASLAALSGVLYGVTERIKWDMGFQILLLQFAAVLVGGLGTAFGTIAGAMVVGVVTQVSTLWIDVQVRLAATLFIVIVVLLFRPQGMFGRKERIG